MGKTCLCFAGKFNRNIKIHHLSLACHKIFRVTRLFCPKQHFLLSKASKQFHYNSSGLLTAQQVYLQYRTASQGFRRTFALPSTLPQSMDFPHLPFSVLILRGVYTNIQLLRGLGMNDAMIQDSIMQDSISIKEDPPIMSVADVGIKEDPPGVLAIKNLRPGVIGGVPVLVGSRKWSG